MSDRSRTEGLIKKVLAHMRPGVDYYVRDLVITTWLSVNSVSNALLAAREQGLVTFDLQTARFRLAEQPLPNDPPTS